MTHYFNPNKPEMTVTPNEDQTVKVRCNESTHEIAWEDQSEEGVTVVIKPKTAKQNDAV